MTGTIVVGLIYIIFAIIVKFKPSGYFCAPVRQRDHGIRDRTPSGDHQYPAASGQDHDHVHRGNDSPAGNGFHTGDLDDRDHACRHLRLQPVEKTAV